MFRNRSLRLALVTVLVTGAVGVALATAGSAAPSVVRLHLGSDGRFFQYGTTTQSLTTASNSCKVNSTACHAPHVDGHPVCARTGLRLHRGQGLFE